MDREPDFAAARAAFASLAPEAPSRGFDERLRRRLSPAPARRWTWTDFFALTPSLAAAAVVGFALFRLGRVPRAPIPPRVEAPSPGYDVGRWGYEPPESPCSTDRDCS
jgi:hypothetical protein